MENKKRTIIIVKDTHDSKKTINNGLHDVKIIKFR